MSTVRIQVRRGVSTGAGSWYSVNPTLAAGEIGLETDTGNFKFGDGSTAWNALGYALADSLTDYIPLSQKGVASGIASLDSSGFVPTAQLPPLAKVTVSSVANQAARLALTAEVGDIAIQADSGASYILQTTGASTDANWKELVGNEKVQDVIGAMLSGNTETGITVTYEDSDGTIDFVVADQFSTHTTSDLAEGTNKYYTDQRVTDLLSTTIDSKLAKSGGTMTGAITLSGAPTADLHAATKLYVDNVTAGLNFHEPVRVSTVLNISLSGEQTIDGVSIVAGDRVLVKNQTTATQNGIYVASAGAWSRAADADNTPNSEIKGGDFTFVLEGTVGSGYGYVCSNTSAITIGTTNITYTPFNAAKAISAGYGLLENVPGALSIDSFVTQNAEIQTLTNKTINMTSNTVTGTLSEFNTALSDANFVTLDNTVTLTNKTVNLANNTFSGTVAEFNTAVSDGNFATLTGNETLTGKTLTAANNTISVNLSDVIDVTATAAEVNALAGITASSAELNILDGALISTAELNILDGVTASSAELNILDGVTSTAAELNILDGVTATALELNILDGVTATAAELNILDGALLDVNELNILNGVTSTTAELNILDGVTATAAELNILDGATLSVTELNYVDGVTSAIQTQLDGKQATVLNVSDVEIGYLDGVTSGIQTQLNAKAPLASPTFTGTVTLPSGTVTSTMILDGTIVDADISSSAAIATSKISGLDTALTAKAPLASPTFTGTVTIPAGASISGFAPLASPALTGVPTAPTAAAATNTTQVATTAYVRGEVAALVNSAGSTLDTLGEIATALGNDANLSATLTTAIGLKAPLASPTFTGTVTIPAGASISGFAPLASPTFTGTNNVAALTASGLITASSSGVAFTDGTQTKEGVPSRTPIIQKTASYTLSALTERDSLIEVASASGTTITIPTNSAVAYPVGTSIDILQTSTGQVTIAGDTGVTVNATPGLKLRTTWSSCTLFKRATNTWVVYGDLTA